MILNTFNTERVIKCFEFLKETSDNSLMTDSNYVLPIEEAKKCDYLIISYCAMFHRLELKRFDPNETHYYSMVEMMPYEEFCNKILLASYTNLEEQINKYRI
jgi:hypothetical protein